MFAFGNRQQSIRLNQMNKGGGLGRHISILAALLSLTASINASDWPLKNIKDYADANGVVSDAQFRRAVAEAKSNYGTLILSAGTYVINDDPIDLITYDREMYPNPSKDGYYPVCNLQGASRKDVRIIFNSSKDVPLFRVQGSSGRGTSVRISNLTIISNPEGGNRESRKNTAIELDQSIGSIIDNVKIENFGTGILIQDNGYEKGTEGDPQKAWNELNSFNHVYIDGCKTAIHQKHAGINLDESKEPCRSTHGNIFDPVFINVHKDDVGFKNESWYYHGRFNFFFWTYDSLDMVPTLIENNIYSIGNFGNVTWEGKRAQIKGKELFEFDGDIKNATQEGKEELIDKSNGNISWSKKPQPPRDLAKEGKYLKKKLLEGNITPDLNPNTVKVILPPEFTAGVYRINAFAHVGGVEALSYQTAIMIIPSLTPGIKPMIVQQAGYDYKSDVARLRLAIEPVGKTNSTYYDSTVKHHFQITYSHNLAPWECSADPQNVYYEVVKIGEGGLN